MKLQTFEDGRVGTVCDMELHWQVDVDEASPQHAKSFSSTHTFPQTHRAPSQLHIRTCGPLGSVDLQQAALRAALDHAAERRHRSIRRSVAASLRLSPSGCPLGTPRAAPKVCRRPQPSNPTHFYPLLRFLTLMCPAVCVYAGAQGRA